MTDFIINVDYDDADIQRTFQRLIAAGSDMQDMFENIGEYLSGEHKERWQQGVDSLGFAWPELTEATWARKKGPSAMHESGTMLEGTVYQASATELLFGPTDHSVPGHSLAAIHHFGVTENNLPAREILGINSHDEDMILDIMQDYLAEVIE